MTLMNTFDATEATPVSPYDSDFIPFQIIANSIHDVFNNAILTPGVMVRRFSVSASMYNFFLHSLLQVILCQTNIFCHQLTQNTMSDLVRFTKIYTNCSEIQKTSVEFQNNLCKSS